MVLGTFCQHCGKEDDLEFDCIIPCGDAHHKYDTSQRMSFYWQQHKKKNIQVLCSKCNSKKSLSDKETIPF